MIFLSIDGACRRNGKPDCLSAGAMFARVDDRFGAAVCDEKGSTNQRGELSALVIALMQGAKLCRETDAEEFYLITDSEYVYNCISKKWYENWVAKNWVTAQGTPVKSRDLWLKAAQTLTSMELAGHEVIPYHIKGHLVSVGKVTAGKIIDSDPTGEKLYNKVQDLYEEHKMKKPDKFEHALNVFKKNHGFIPPEDTFREMVVCNTVTDYIAGHHADLVDKAWIR